MVRFALTFDDGTLHQYELLRSLADMRVKATLFCISSLKIHPEYRVKLLASEPALIRELHLVGHEIASHTCTHPRLTDIDEHSLESELADSKQILEDMIHDSVVGFAYPYSAYNAAVVRRVSKYYDYARAGPLKRASIGSDTDRRYLISSTGMKGLLAMLLSGEIGRMGDEPIVIMLHEIPHEMIFPLARFIRRLRGASFITMTEAADFISSSSS